MNFKHRRISAANKALLLLIYFIVTAMIPNCILAVTEMYSPWSVAAGLLLPAGVYMMGGSAIRRTGVAVLLFVWLTVLCIFQIVLLFLFGNSIIATDMYVNIITTNPGEANELLINLTPAVITAFAIYAPMVAYAVFAAHRRYRITRHMRRIFVCTGAALAVAGGVAAVPACVKSGRNIIVKEIFPVDVLYNLALSFRIRYQVFNYETSSADFDYRAVRTDKPGHREIYVYIIGEASRAANWQLYGYGRGTNPRLSGRSDITVFRNVLTQSNTTHKSVPMFLSSAGAVDHDDIYRRKGLAALFRQAGFSTYFISNQSPQGAMVDLLANEADERIYIGAPRYDMQLLSMMRRIIESDKESNLLFILHCYGSHFSYHQRYPREYAAFMPDDDVPILARNIEMITNAYDNSIVYTDAVIDEIINYIGSLDACAAVLYCSDHGEDILDDRRGRFLHSSPTVTYWQLHIPCLAWFSPVYAELYPQRAVAAEDNRWAPVTTYSMFHTMADIASIRSDFVNTGVSLVSPAFDRDLPRYYLDDHGQAVPFDRRIGLNADDMRCFRQHGIRSL